MAREKHKRRKSRGESTEAEHWDGPIRISDEGPVMGTGAKGSGSGGRMVETTGNRKMQIHTTDKPFNITKKQVYEAYKAVKSNAGSAGVDRQTIEQFDSDLRRNLYKLWNRMSSGSYFPPPVRAVSIPKKTGGQRILGVPTVADRVAQMVVKQLIEPDLEPIFLADSYGYRPRKSALDAVGVTRKRYWKYDWVLEFDIKGLFDNIDHELLLRAVRKHVTCKWALLYIERWLTAPMEHDDGMKAERTRGTPQGGVVSPILANLFLHLHVRSLDDTAAPRPPVVSICRRWVGALPERARSSGTEDRASSTVGRMPPGNASDENQDRLLQGREPQRQVSEYAIRLPRIWLSAPAGSTLQRQHAVLGLQPGGQRLGAEGHAGGD